MKTGLIFTDIHFGKKSNSAQHLGDCLDYIDWVCDYVRQSQTIDYIAFLGDWFENRININIFTLDVSYVAAQKLNDLGIPIFFCVGNHDLAERNSREVYSTNSMNALNNFIVINEPTIRTDIQDGVLFCPFLMKDEYDDLKEVSPDVKVWMGHFEFKGFILTGGSVRLEHGPDSSQFTKPVAILSGHFHKRQSQRNVHYIGNTFPMDFGDSGDYNRGFALYHHDTHTMEYVDWDKGPRYLSTVTSKVIADPSTIPNNCYLYVDVDTSMKYDELRALKDLIIQQQPSLRSVEFNENSTRIKEIQKLNSAGDDILAEDDDSSSNSTLNDLVIRLLENTTIPSFDNATLAQIYRELK